MVSGEWFLIFDVMKPIIESNLKEAREVLDDFLSKPENIEAIECAARILIETVQSGTNTSFLLLNQE